MTLRVGLDKHVSDEGPDRDPLGMFEPVALGRRRFLHLLGGAVVAQAAGSIPSGESGAIFFPSARADDASPALLAGKDPGLRLLNDRPINAEATAHLLDDAITPASRLFVRNNGAPPMEVDLDTWTLTIDGESATRSVSFTLAQLKKQFAHYSYQLTLECGGNGRSEFYPPVPGNQWRNGAVGCARWTGVRLRDVLEFVGIRDDAVYIGYFGADTHLSGDPGKIPISRGAPMSKALEDETLIAWAMNDAPIPRLHGHPLRLVVGGWPASVSGKWLKRITVRSQIHDGPKMGGQSYRVPCEPVAPGTAVPDDAMCIIESMPVKSLITSPISGERVGRAEPMPLRGHAWAGDLQVDRVDVSTDFGQTWQPAGLTAPANRLAWQHFSATVEFSQPGYYEVWARATDSAGRAQPMILPGWNPRGYLNNACHRLAVQVT
ncbi:MAG: sulfite oxidase [Halieaceae bacterium]